MREALSPTGVRLVGQGTPGALRTQLLEDEGAAAWVTILPAAWLLVCTVSAGLLKLFSPDPKVGFAAHAAKFQDAIARGELLAPAKTAAEMKAILFNDRVDIMLTGLFIAVLLSILCFGIRSCAAAWQNEHPSARELPDRPVAA